MLVLDIFPVFFCLLTIKSSYGGNRQLCSLNGDCFIYKPRGYKCIVSCMHSLWTVKWNDSILPSAGLWAIAAHWNYHRINCNTLVCIIWNICTNSLLQSLYNQVLKWRNVFEIGPNFFCLFSMCVLKETEIGLLFGSATICLSFCLQSSIIFLESNCFALCHLSAELKLFT